MEPKRDSKTLTEMQKKFLAALFGEAFGNFAEAKRLAGYSEYTTTAEVIAPLKDEIIRHTQDYLVANAPKAVMKITGALDERQPNANMLKAAAMILDRVGVIERKAGDAVELNVPKGGIFILPAKEAHSFEKYKAADEDEGE